MRAPRGVAWLAALALLLGLAGGCASPRPTATPCAVPTPRDTSPASSGRPTHAYPDLEDLIPTDIGCQILQSASVVSDPSLQDPKTLRVLSRLGRTAADLEVATAGSAAVDVTIVALRVVGATGPAAAAAFQAEDQGDPTTTSVYGTATIAGKSVSTRTTASETEYIYAIGSVMFVVSGSATLVAEAIGKLP